MITDLIVNCVVSIIDTLLTLADDIIPDAVLSWLSTVGTGLASFMRFTPLTSVFLLMSVWLVWDTALNAYQFAVETYRLLPAKFT